MMRNISLASIIAESQQGENAARRAVPSSAVADMADIQLYQQPQKEVNQTDAGQNSVRQDQERIKLQLEQKKKDLEEANSAAKKEVGSVTDSLEQIKNTDYVNTFLKIFNLTSSIG